MIRLAAVVGVLALGVACGNDCGSYQYKGVLGTEWCGDVYGTDGSVAGGPDDVAWVELTFDHDVPPNEFTFDHSGSVRAVMFEADLESGAPMGPDRVFTECSWTDFGDPRRDDDDTPHLEPATEVEIEGHGSGFNLEPDVAKVRDISWHIVCGDGVIRLDARDNVKLDRVGETETLHRDLADWVAAQEDAGL